MGDSQRKLTRGESQQKDSFNSAYNNFQDSNGLTDIKFRRKYKNNKKNFAIFKMKPTKSPLMKMDKLSHQSRSKTKLDGNFCMKWFSLDYSEEYKDIEKKYLSYKNLVNSPKNDINIINHEEDNFDISIWEKADIILEDSSKF